MTIYTPLASGVRLRTTTTVEAIAQLKYHTAGTFARLIAAVQTNTATGASTVDFRKGGVSGANTVSIGAGATGLFEDTTNTDTIAVNDLVNMRIVNGGGGTLTIYQAGLVYTATAGNTTGKLAAHNGHDSVGTSVTNMFNLIGRLNPAGAEAAAQLRIGAPYTAQFFSVYVDNNTRTDTTVYRTRKNTANGNQTVSIGTTATGLFEDTTNSDALVAGDLFNYSETLASGSGQIGAWTVSSELRGSRQSHMFAAGDATGAVALAAGSTNYLAPYGGMELVSLTEADVQMKLRALLTLSYAALYVTANATSAGSTVTMRKNAAAATLTMTVGAGATGLFSDVTNTEPCLATDLVNWQVVTGAGGTLTLSMLSGLAEDPSILPLGYTAPNLVRF